MPWDLFDRELDEIFMGLSIQGFSWKVNQNTIPFLLKCSPFFSILYLQASSLEGQEESVVTDYILKVHAPAEICQFCNDKCYVGGD